MKTVLLIGASGFIPSYTMSKLVDLGHRCVSYSRAPPPQGVRLYDREMIEFVLGDVTDWGNILDTIKRYDVDTICYGSHMMSVPSQLRPPVAVEVNVIGPLNALEAARLLDVERFVLISGSSVYGRTFYELEEVVTEDMPLWPTHVYGADKVFTEHLLRNYCDEYGFEGVAVRPSDVTGPGKSMRGLHHVKEIVEEAFFQKYVVLPFVKDAYINMSYVKDVATGIALSCSLPMQHKYREYNIVAGIVKPYPKVNDFIRAVKKQVPDAVLEVLPEPEIFEMWEGYLDISRAEEELGYTPRFRTPGDMVKDWINVLEKYPFMQAVDRYGGIAFPWT